MNLYIGASEVWGPSSKADDLSYYFLHKWVEVSLIDIVPTQINPTWCNNKVGEARVSKWLDIFLSSEGKIQAMGFAGGQSN